MLQYNKTLYSNIYEKIYELEQEVFDQKETILQDKKDLAHINFRIVQARSKQTFVEYIPHLFSILEYILNRQRIHREDLARSLNSITELRKRILTG